MPKAAVFNIDFYYGKKFEETWTWLDRFGNPIDLSTYAAELTVVEDPRNDNPRILARETDSGNITLGSDGTIKITIGGQKTSIGGIKKAYFALIVYSSGTIDDDGEQIVEGQVRIHESRN